MQLLTQTGVGKTAVKLCALDLNHRRHGPESRTSAKRKYLPFRKLQPPEIPAHFCILYSPRQSRLRAVLFILDTNWTQRFSRHIPIARRLAEQSSIPRGFSGSSSSSLFTHELVRIASLAEQRQIDSPKDEP
jgi:hypothetical protein